MFNLKDSSKMKKANNMNFLSRHFGSQSTSKFAGRESFGPKETISQTDGTKTVEAPAKPIEGNPVPQEGPTNPPQNAFNTGNTVASARSELTSFNSPRIGLKRGSQPDMLLNVSGKINMASAAELLNRKNSVPRKEGQSDEIVKTKKWVASFFEGDLKTKPQDLKVMIDNQANHRTVDNSNGSSTTKKPWRMFSFDKKEKVKTQENESGFTDVVTQVKCPQELNPSMTKDELKIFNKKKSFSNLAIKPNYYMKSLEYYFVMEKTDYFSKLYKEHFQLSYNSMKFIKMLSQADADKFSQENKLNLKKKIFYNNKKTLIFDLDETLVHCAEGSDLGDTNIKITFPNSKEVEASIFLRPYVRDVLKSLSQEFEIIIFTASHRGYADKVIDILDPDKQWVSHRLFREHCFQSKQGVYVKDLRVINRKMKDMIIVDNALYSYGLQIDNGVPIIPYYNCKEDAELLMLQEYLLSLREEDDIREINRFVFKYDCYREAENLSACFLQLFSNQKQKRGTSANKRPPSVGPEGLKN